MNDGDLVLKVGNTNIQGWESIRVTIGMERCPNDFTLTMSERYAKEFDKVTVRKGEPCTVEIGGKRVITGYVNRFSPSIAAKKHTITVSGRGKCQDLVDCAANWKGGVFKNLTLEKIATPLAKLFGINVKMRANPPKIIPTFVLQYGETNFEIIQRLSKYSKLLCYEDEYGDLVFSDVNFTQAASGIVEGLNVKEAQYISSDDQRFSDYFGFMAAVDPFQSELSSTANMIGTVKDEEIKRYRPMFIVAENGDIGYQVLQDRLTWERNRRYGRGNQLRVVVDSWKDKAGDLWRPNTLVNVNLPTLKLKNLQWTISEVSFLRDNDGGTRSELLLMPPEAFSVQPIIFQPFPLVELGLPNQELPR